MRKNNTRISIYITSIILCVAFVSLSLLVFGIFSPATASSPSDALEENTAPFLYHIDQQEAIIDRYQGSEAHLIIPEEIEGFPVTMISEYAFSNHPELLSVTIPFSLERINSNAFSNCLNLKAVIILSGDTELATNSFDEYNITKFYCLPGSQALDYAYTHDIPYELFIEGTTWQSEYSSDQFVFGSNGKLIISQVNSKTQDEAQYSIDQDDSLYLLFNLGFDPRIQHDHYVSRTARIQGNRLYAQSNELLPAYRFVCQSSTGIQPDLGFCKHFTPSKSLVGTRWQERGEDAQVQFIDNNTAEYIDGTGELLERFSYNMDKSMGTINVYDEALALFIKQSTLFISDENYSDCFDYIGAPIPATVTTPTPAPTATPTPTATPAPVALTKEIVVGSWGNGSLIFYEDGTAQCKKDKGRWYIQNGDVGFHYTESDGYPGLTVYYWNGYDTLTDLWANYTKDH